MDIANFVKETDAAGGVWCAETLFSVIQNPKANVTKEDFLRPAEWLCDSIIAGLNLAQG